MADVMGILQRTRTLELEIKTQLEHIEMIHRIAGRVRESTSYAEETVEKLARLEQQLNRTIDEMYDVKRDALRIVSCLSGEERSVIEGYYILAKNWDRLALDLYMSERRIFMLRKSGLAKIMARYGSNPQSGSEITARL